MTLRSRDFEFVSALGTIDQNRCLSEENQQLGEHGGASRLLLVPFPTR
jgi:hypothetical protein